MTAPSRNRHARHDINPEPARRSGTREAIRAPLRHARLDKRGHISAGVSWLVRSWVVNVQVIPEGAGPCQGLGDLRFGLFSTATNNVGGGDSVSGRFLR